MAYKMKGFSGFGNSPAKQTTDDDDALIKRSKAVSENDAKIEALENDLLDEKITKEEYDNKMVSIRAEEEKVKKPL